MNDRNIKNLVLGALCVMVALQSASAQPYRWTGSGANTNWSTPENWEGNAVPPSLSTLLFGVADSYTVNRDIGTSFSPLPNQMIFEADAEAYTFTGNRIRLANAGLQVVNLSGETQTFSSGLEMGNAAGIINTANGDIVVEGGISGGNNRVPQKHGIGTLSIRGVSNVQLQNSIYAGTLSLDENAQSFGGVNNISFSPDNTAVYEINGATSGVTTVNKTVLTLNTGLGAGIGIRLNANGGDGVQLVFGGGTSALTWFGASGRGNTFHVDLSTSAGNGVSFASLNSNAALSASGIWGWATVKDTTATGFGTLVGGDMVRNTTSTAFDGSVVTDTATNYHVAGSATLTANRSVGSLTIQSPSGGEMAGSFILTTGGLLMQEGAADYMVSSSIWGTSDRLYLHQYSTAGSLILSGAIQRDTPAGYVVKAGPGTVVVTEDGRLLQQGVTGIQGGRFVLDGQIEKSSEVNVYDGATLEGSGSIGTLSPSAVRIFGGGILAAETGGALDITGTLTLDAYAEYSMTLDYLGADFLEASSTITLNDAVNLSLVLAGEPILSEKVYLMKGSDIVGNFATINGEAFGPGGQFSLEWNSESYDFQLFNQNGEIWVEAVPEPQTAVLVLTAVLIALTGARRRTSGTPA